MRSCLLSCVFGLALALSPYAAAQVTTSQYDNFRTGATADATLTPANVNAVQFGKIGAFKVDGTVYAQPLYLASVEIPGKGKHNVLFVATEHDSIYAFDAERPSDPPLWQVSFLDEKRGIRPVAAFDVRCPFIQPEVGITSTPVIDLASGTLYVLARTKGDGYFQHLHALAITTGAEKFGGPTLITASVPGKGAGSSGGKVAFDALRENPRTPLLLVNGQVVLTWGSSCDVGPYHGWIMTYDAKTLAQTAVFNVSPDGREGGIWTSDAGIAADAAGNFYVPTGNGNFTAAAGGRDYGDSLLKMAFEHGTLVVRDYFTPHNEQRLDAADADLGSSGPLLLPDQPGPHPHLLLQPGKGDTIYVIDRDHLGKFQPGQGAAVQEIRMLDGGYGAMAYWHGHAYFVASDDYLRDYRVSGNGIELAATSHEPRFENPGATPSISYNGDKSAIIWTIATKTWNGRDRPAILYAFDAADISRPIYTSEQNSARDRAALATRFSIPVVVKGRVYFGARGEVEVYGLLPSK